MKGWDAAALAAKAVHLVHEKAHSLPAQAPVPPRTLAYAPVPVTTLQARRIGEGRWRNTHQEFCVPAFAHEALEAARKGEGICRKVLVDVEPAYSPATHEFRLWPEI